MIKVTIEPKFGDEKMQGEYDDELYGEAGQKLTEAVTAAIAAGARSDNIEHAVMGGIENAGIE